MKTIIKAVLLALTLVIVFFSPAKLGVVLYYSLFPFLFVLVYLYYRISYGVSEKDVQKVRSEPYNLTLFCGMVPPLGEGDLIRGRLVIDNKQIVLYKRLDKDYSKATPCKPVWNLAVSELSSIGVGPVLSVRKGLVFYVGENSFRFVYAKAKKQKNRIIEALGWSENPQIPQGVQVFSDAASAPSFSKAVEHKDTEKEKD
jgi:Ca2+/Na+ antiporter